MNDLDPIPRLDRPPPDLPATVGLRIDVTDLITEAGPAIACFTATIENSNTARAYLTACSRFIAWCAGQGFSLATLSPTAVAAYPETLKAKLAPSSVKQHLAAIRMFLDWLVTGQILPSNPAASVQGPKLIATPGKTRVLAADQARHLLDSIDVRTVVDLRDRAILAAMVYSFARVGAIVAMNIEDYMDGKRSWLHRAEKDGKAHAMPAHHNSEKYLDAYIEAAGLAGEPKSPLFRSASGRRVNALSGNRMSRNDVLRTLKRKARSAGLPARICCHSIRATGITAYLENSDTL